jgi:hypothetical protein
MSNPPGQEKLQPTQNIPLHKDLSTGLQRRFDFFDLASVAQPVCCNHQRRS